MTVWSIASRDLVSDSGVSPPVCDHRVVPDCGVACARYNPRGSAVDACRDATAGARRAARAADDGVVDVPQPCMDRPYTAHAMRNGLLDLITYLPTTACHQRNDVEIYSKSIVYWSKKTLSSFAVCLCFYQTKRVIALSGAWVIDNDAGTLKRKEAFCRERCIGWPEVSAPSSELSMSTTQGDGSEPNRLPLDLPRPVLHVILVVLETIFALIRKKKVSIPS